MMPPPPQEAPVALANASPTHYRLAGVRVTMWRMDSMDGVLQDGTAA